MNNTDNQASNRAYREQWWRAVLASDLTAGQKIVATGLGWHMNFNPEHQWYQCAWRSAGELAKEIGMTEGSVQNALAALRRLGWLESKGRTTGGRGAHIHRFVLPEINRSTPSSVVHQPVKSTEECSQSTPSSVVRVHQPVESESTEEWRDSMSYSLNDNNTHSREASALSFSDFSEEDLAQFRDAYPKRMTTHLLRDPYRQAIEEQGATPSDLLSAAENYAHECKRTNQPVRFMKLASKFLREESWRDYCGSSDPDTRFESNRQAVLDSIAYDRAQEERPF